MVSEAGFYDICFLIREKPWLGAQICQLVNRLVARKGIADLEHDLLMGLQLQSGSLPAGDSDPLDPKNEPFFTFWDPVAKMTARRQAPPVSATVFAG